MGAFEFKKRTKFGKWIDQNRISQEWLIKNIGLNRKTVYSICNDTEHNPQDVTQLKIVSKLRREGYDVSVSDFW